MTFDLTPEGGDYMVDGQIIDQPIANPHAPGKDVEQPQVRQSRPWRALWHYSAKRAVRDNKTLTAPRQRNLFAAV